MTNLPAWAQEKARKFVFGVAEHECGSLLGLGCPTCDYRVERLATLLVEIVRDKQYEQWQADQHVTAEELDKLRTRNAEIVRNAQRLRCVEHATDASNGWGCPCCVFDLRNKLREVEADAEGWRSRFRAILDEDTPATAGNAVLHLQDKLAQAQAEIERLKEAGRRFDGLVAQRIRDLEAREAKLREALISIKKLVDEGASLSLIFWRADAALAASPEPAPHPFEPCREGDEGDDPAHNFTCALLCVVCGLPREKHAEPAPPEEKP